MHPTHKLYYLFSLQDHCAFIAKLGLYNELKALHSRELLGWCPTAIAQNQSPPTEFSNKAFQDLCPFLPFLYSNEKAYGKHGVV